MHGFNSLIVFRLVCLVFLSFVTLFCVCELGGMVSDLFAEFNDGLNQCDWYLFPLEVRPIFVMIITNSQQPVLVRGFANTMCVREYFKRVKQFCHINCMFYWHVWSPLWTISNYKFEFFSSLFFVYQIIRTSFSYFMAMHRIYGWIKYSAKNLWKIDFTQYRSSVISVFIAKHFV